ncbi:hypothetical protein VH569_30030 [Azospirillum sp. 11R-A]|uniref:hypothetical protein n=1 Tax=Azospirillum sp. 11R-A TaxID=3111634 RepID=UPI003C17A968
MMFGHGLRASSLAALMLGLAACAGGTGEASRTTTSGRQGGMTSQSGMKHSEMGQMDHAQMMQHCRDMMQGSSGSMASGTMGQMDHAQMMQHCQAMMGQTNQSGAPARR